MAERSAAALTAPIVIRPLRDVEEMGIGAELQRKIWGYSEADTIPEQMFVVARESGGGVLAAFHDEQPVGFALAFAGIHGTKAHLHSHMVGAIREYQDRGVGRLLKLAQRDDALARGIELIEWTFDPLQLKNAHFNLAKLGAIVRRYIPNVYGRTSSPLHAGLPTDRLVAEWWVRSAHVPEVLSGKRRTPAVRTSRISIPAAIQQICSDNSPLAQHIQCNAREQFAKLMAEGFAATGFEFTENQGSYLMEPYEDRNDQAS